VPNVVGRGFPCAEPGCRREAILTVYVRWVWQAPAFEREAYCEKHWREAVHRLFSGEARGGLRPFEVIW
jgi:hypothetical protein